MRVGWPAVVGPGVASPTGGGGVWPESGGQGADVRTSVPPVWVGTGVVVSDRVGGAWWVLV